MLSAKRCGGARKHAICALEMARSAQGLNLHNDTQFRAQIRNTEQVDDRTEL